MANRTLCTSPDCPIARTCARHEASGAVVEQPRQTDRWHWRRETFGEGIVCNGFEPARAQDGFALKCGAL